MSDGVFFFQAEDGIRDLVRSRGLGDVYKRQQVLDGLSEKLIRRHPHIFGTATVTDADHVKRQWDEIKRSENGKEKRESLLDGIPVDLPALARAHKTVSYTHLTLPTSDLV